MSDIIEPEIICIHNGPRVHCIRDNCRRVTAQIVIDQIPIPDVRQPIDSFQCFAGLKIHLTLNQNSNKQQTVYITGEQFKLS